MMDEAPGSDVGTTSTTTSSSSSSSSAGSSSAGSLPMAATAGTSTTATPANPAAAGGAGGATVVQLQQPRRRQQYFFRTTSSMGTDGGGGWGGDSTVTPRSSGDYAGLAAGEALRQLAWALALNGGIAVLLLGVVEALVLPILVASLELTPSPRISKLLTALLTAHLFQAGARGTLLLLLALGCSAAGLALTGGSWGKGFVPLFLAWYVGLDTFSRLAGGGGGGASNAGGLPSTASGLGAGLGGGLKTLSEASSARERGWSPVGRWRLWGA